MNNIPKYILDFVEENKDIKSTHNVVPDKDSNRIRLKRGLPWLLWDTEFPREEMLREAKLLYKMGRYVPHRAGAGIGWTSLCIHGLGAEQTQISTSYGVSESEAKYDWTDVAAYCPVTTAYFKNKCPVWEKYMRVRFMALESNGHVVPHHDGPGRGLGAINYALNNPEGCNFYMEGRGIVPFKEGTAYKLDISIKHCVVNLGDETRFHLIVHSDYASPEHKKKILTGYYNT